MILGNCSRRGVAITINDYYDTLDLARRLIVSENYKLGNLAKQLNLATATHSADDDVAATIGLLDYLVDKLQHDAESRKNLFKTLGKKFYLLANLISGWQKDLSDLRPAELLIKVWQESGLEEYYQSEIDIKRQENFKLLHRLFKERDQKEKTAKTALRDLINFSVLSRDIDFLGLDQGKVPVITIHQSKGLEFDHVFLVGMNQGTFPRYREDQLEEQKRLFYVALTRAKEYLYLSYSNFDPYNKPLMRSMFLDYIDNKYIK
jgi:DNA helicase-2/ATP-dependent DNA helicase PcrA